MGTVVTFDVRLADEARRADLAGALLRRLDAVFSLWRPESPASRLRRGELRLEDAPAEVAAVAAACERARLATAGWFDAELPGGFDPTGLVKGWAAARALEVLCRAGFGDCLVNAGGDIAAAGSPGGGEPWRIGIRDPASPGRVAAVAEVRGAIATSGTYERGAHLVNPRTGRHEARFASATVTGPDLGLADAAATALAVAGREGFAFVAALDGYEALAIGYDGTVLASPAFPLADPGDVAHGRPGDRLVAGRARRRAGGGLPPSRRREGRRSGAPAGLARGRRRPGGGPGSAAPDGRGERPADGGDGAPPRRPPVPRGPDGPVRRAPALVARGDRPRPRPARALEARLDLVALRPLLPRRRSLPAGGPAAPAASRPRTARRRLDGRPPRLGDRLLAGRTAPPRPRRGAQAQLRRLVPRPRRPRPRPRAARGAPRGARREGGTRVAALVRARPRPARPRRRLARRRAVRGGRGPPRHHRLVARARGARRPRAPGTLRPGGT